jgi:DNA/RNA endonuclease G (NUC1)
MLKLISPNMKILYNPILKVPHKIDYVIDPLKKLRGGRRNFIYDKRIPVESQLSPDFSLRGYSRGHLVPSFVMSWDKVAWTETYRMTNIAIQNVHFNIGNWNKLELDIYEFAKKTGRKLNAVTGVSEEGKMMNGYFIPDYFYTTISNDYSEKRYFGENNHRGKIWLK